ncbi:hypothetical protein ACFVQ0_27115 [Streptomyces sp. NPDC057900]|uniref:hypothetical protein n=1 Tax=Streptomyces sp. NPDC057900 TaxID=3346274 RepID=UPI0036E6E501
MNLRKSLTLSLAALALGSGLATANPATAAPEKAVPAKAVSMNAVSAKAGWHTLHSNFWVPAQRSGQWKSKAYKSPSRKTRVVLRCYNTKATMRVRLYEATGGKKLRKVADSGSKRCNPNGAVIAAGVTNSTHDWLKIRLDGKQGSYVRTEKWS